MPRLYPSQEYNLKDWNDNPTKKETRTAEEYYHTEQEAASNMLVNLYGHGSTGSSGLLIDKYVRTEDGKKVGIQYYQTNRRFSRHELEERDPANLAAYFHNNPGKKLVVYLPTYDENNKPVPGKDSLHYLSLNYKTGMYEISDKPVKSPNVEFLTEARLNFAKDASNRSYHQLSGVHDFVSTDVDRKWLAERSKHRYDSMQTPEFKERLKLEAEWQEKDAKFYEEHKEEIEAEKARQREEYDKRRVAEEKRLKEEQAKREKEEAKRRKEEEKKLKAEQKQREKEEKLRAAEAKKNEEIIEKRFRESQEKFEQEEKIRAAEEEKIQAEQREKEEAEKDRIQKEENRIKAEAEREEIENIFDSMPMEFPGAKNYAAEKPDKEDPLYSKLGFGKNLGGGYYDTDLVNHNLNDRKEMLEQMSEALFGDKHIHRYIKNADGSSIFMGEHRLRTTDRFRSEQKSRDFSEEIFAILNDAPDTKFQIYWPKDQSIHLMGFDPQTLKYSISKNPIPVPKNEAKLAEYNKTLSEFKKAYKHNPNVMRWAIKDAKATLADKENVERITEGVSKAFNEENAKISETWFDALLSNPAVKVKGSPEAEFILSCNDKTAHGRTRVYEFALTECIKAFTQAPADAAEKKYFDKLQKNLPDMISSMHRDGYEPANADYKELENLQANYLTVYSMSTKICNELPQFKGSKAIDKLCEVVYLNTFKQQNGMADPQKFEEAVSPENIAKSVAKMRKTMSAIVKKDGSSLAKKLQGKTVDEISGVLTSRFAEALGKGPKVQTKENRKIENAGPSIG